MRPAVHAVTQRRGHVQLQAVSLPRAEEQGGNRTRRCLEHGHPEQLHHGGYQVTVAISIVVSLSTLCASGFVDYVIFPAVGLPAISTLSMQVACLMQV